MIEIERQRAAESAGHPEWAEMPKTRRGAWLADVTQYFTGRSCKHGHVAPQTRSAGTCVECDADQQRNWRTGVGREKFNAYQREYQRKLRREAGVLPRMTLEDRMVDGVLLMSPGEVQRIFGRGGRATERLCREVEATHKYWTKAGQCRPFRCAASVSADVEAVMQKLGAMRWEAV